MYLDSNNRFHPTGARSTHCPNCSANARMIPTSTPDFVDLQRIKPATAGVVFHCDECHAPVFRKYRIKNFADESIEFHPDGQDVERRDGQFKSQYLPAVAAAYFNDALGCYQAGLVQAFAAMCRLTIQAIISENGDSMQLRLYDLVDDIASLAELDDAEMTTVQDILFDSRPDSIYRGDLDRGSAAILLEVMKDLLHQTYIRRGRLGKALKMRQFFARRDDLNNDDTTRQSVTNLPVGGRRSTGSGHS
jgi:hypothetical protein